MEREQNVEADLRGENEQRGGDFSEVTVAAGDEGVHPEEDANDYDEAGDEEHLDLTTEKSTVAGEESKDHHHEDHKEIHMDEQEVDHNGSTRAEPAENVEEDTAVKDHEKIHVDSDREEPDNAGSTSEVSTHDTADKQGYQNKSGENQVEVKDHGTEAAGQDGENTDRHEEQDEEQITSLSVLVRSGGVGTGQVLDDEDRVEMTAETYGEVGTGARERMTARSDDLVRQYSSDAAVTVRFLLIPSQQVATQRCLLNQRVADLRLLFAIEMKIDEETIQVLHDGKVLDDGITLGDLGVVPNGTIQLALQSADPINHPLQLVRPRQDYHMPDVITVRIHIDSVQYRDVVVEIERATSRKPFLGGYRHKSTGAEYHHAAAQTMPRPRAPSAVPRFCRDTQTAQQRHARQQTSNETSTQMTAVGTYVSQQQDRLVVPRRYVTADERHREIIDKVIVIQKYYRRWLATKRVATIRENEKRRREWEKEEEQNKVKEKDTRIKKEYERRMNPKNKEDFDLLFHALERWRKEEVARIDSTLSGAERKAALCMLLDQETQLIASIGRHKLDADHENRQRFIQDFLEKTASPKKWQGPDGKTTELETPYTLRARQLRDIYNSINMKYVTQDERLDVLLTLKHTVKEHDCKLTQEIIELIDREADLLIRGVKESNLDGLRQRISILFLQYIKTPTFNPEAARYLRVPQDASTLRKNIYYCTSCNHYLPSTEFQLSSNSKSVGKCRQCSKMANIAIPRHDFTQYTYMLQNVCREEEAFGNHSKIAFLMQEKDIRYLVEKIWDSQSILSAWNDLYELVLVRWNRNEEWSPWNCILLTKDEASAHQKVDSLENAYGKEFVNRVSHKHTMAKTYFFRLPVMADHMHSNVQDSRHSVVNSALSPSSSSSAARRVVQSSA